MKPEYITTVDHINGNNTDIIRTVEKRFPKAVEQTKEFAQQFRGNNVKQTAHNVWKFLKSYITYKKDDEQKQIIRLPSWFLHTGEGDCKSYSLLSAAILANLGLPVSFRYASYNRFNRTPSHVYTIVNDENGKEIIVDGVWKYFNDQKPPAYQYTHPMEVISMSGIEDDVTGIGKHKGGAFSFAKKLALAPNRRAFRTIVSLNLFGLARKLAKLHKKNPAALAKFWTRIGGKPSELLKSVKKGYNHWAKRHHKVKMAGIDCCVAGPGYYDEQRHLLNTIRITGMNGIGALPAVAALIALAAPVVTAVASVVKKNGADKTEPGEPPMEEAVERSNEIRQSTPNAEATVNGLTRAFAIGDIRIGDMAIGRHKKGKAARGVKKIALAPNRRAFRSFVSVNAGGLAYKLARIAKKDPNALKKQWEKLGGKYSELQKSIRLGLKKVPKKRRKAVAGIGADTETAQKAGGLIATIIKAFASLFKKHGESTKPEPGETTIEKIAAVADTAAEKFGMTNEPADKLVDSGKADTEGDDTPSTAGFSPSPLLLIGGGAALLMLLGKRK